MFTTLLMMVAGFALLYIGAESLIRGGAALALSLGLTPLVVGLTVVAFGTSSPELVVSLSAALAGSGSLAIGNVVGSNICNVALILGLAALIRPMKVEAQLIRLDVPITIACSLILLVFLSDQRLVRWEGFILFAGIIAYVAFSIIQARKAQQEIQEEFSESLPQAPRSLLKDIILIVIGLIFLVIGAHLFVEGSITIALLFGVSEAIIGLTLVAVGTSLPELATSLVAAFKKEGDIAIGNVIGSNIFNILGILGLTALISPVQSNGIGLLDLGLMVGLVIFLFPLMRMGFCINRLNGLFLLLIYVAYITYLIVETT